MSGDEGAPSPRRTNDQMVTMLQIVLAVALCCAGLLKAAFQKKDAKSIYQPVRATVSASRAARIAAMRIDGSESR